MTFSQKLLEKYPIGIKIDYDGSFGYQCFDFANQYHFDATGFEPKIMLAGASQIWDSPNSFFAEKVKYEKIMNSPSNFPKFGDLIIWNNGIGGGFGHVAVVLEANADNFTVLEQDGFNQIGVKKKVWWNYNNVSGWFSILNNNFLENSPQIAKIPSTQIPTNPINEKPPTPETWAKLEKETDDDHFKLVKDAVQNSDLGWLISSYADRVKERKDFEKDADDLNNHYSDLATNFQEAHDKNYIFSKDLAEKDLEIEVLKMEMDDLNSQIGKLEKLPKNEFDFTTPIKKPSQNLENMNSKEIFKDEKNYSEIENVQVNNPTTQEKWSWNKFWVGLSRNATISSIIGIMITGLVGYICSLVPQLTPYQNEMVGGLLLFTGISTVGQNANNLLKK